MKKILLIDDSDTYIWCLQKYLQRRGYPVETASTLKEARTAIQEEMPLVICCDLDLPDGSGMDFLDEVRAADKELPFILVSCHDKEDYEQEAKQRGATLCMDKMKGMLLQDMLVEYAYRQLSGEKAPTFHTLLFVHAEDTSAGVLRAAMLQKGFENTVSLYEQQSTYNPNMSLRGFMYAARFYDKYIHEHKLNIYGTELIMLPVPRLVVFYNGTDEMDDTVLELKDAFRPAVESDISVRVRMVNINYGKNRELLDACRPLSEYAWLIDRIREYKNDMGIEDAVDRALNEMPQEYEIRPFLMGNRAEVKQMCITEYNEAETMQMFKAEGRKEGRK